MQHYWPHTVRVCHITLSHTAASSVLYTVDEGLRGRNILQSVVWLIDSATYLLIKINSLQVYNFYVLTILRTPQVPKRVKQVSVPFHFMLDDWRRRSLVAIKYIWLRCPSLPNAPILMYQAGTCNSQWLQSIAYLPLQWLTANSYTSAFITDMSLALVWASCACNLCW